MYEANAALAGTKSEERSGFEVADLAVQFALLLDADVGFALRLLLLHEITQLLLLKEALQTKVLSI